MSRIVFQTDSRSQKPILITSSNNAGQSFLRRNFIPFNDGTIPGQNQRCKAPGCVENHPSHTCRNCGMINSNHITDNCTKKSCNAKGCTRKHGIHKCRVCHTIDSDHRSSKCPLVTGQFSQPHGHFVVSRQSSPQGHFVVGHQPQGHFVVGHQNGRVFMVNR